VLENSKSSQSFWEDFSSIKYFRPKETGGTFLFSLNQSRAIYGSTSDTKFKFEIKIPEMTVAEKKAKKKILDDEVDAIAIALSHGAYARMQIK
jgi:hypothetical protein